MDDSMAETRRQLEHNNYVVVPHFLLDEQVLFCNITRHTNDGAPRSVEN